MKIVGWFSEMARVKVMSLFFREEIYLEIKWIKKSYISTWQN